MKKIICLVLAILTVLSLAACGGEVVDTTKESTTVSTDGTLPSGTTGTGATAGTEATAGTQATGSTIGTGSTTATGGTTGGVGTTTTTGGGEDPVISDYDFVIVEIGEYAELMYRPGVCDIKTDIKKGLGSKETLTFTIELANGYTFDGWTLTNGIVNGKDKLNGKTDYYDSVLVKDKTFVFEASEDIIPDGKDRILIVPNYSYTVTYHSNGGTAKDGKNTYVQKYTAVSHNCVSTLPEQGFFTRDGYTLVEYNTKADGTGYAVSLGSKMPMGGKATTELYCIWEKQNDASDFTYKISGSEVYITAYTGTSTTVVVPSMIEGKKVTKINSLVTKTEVTKVVLPSTIKSVERNAMTSMKKLETFVMFDGIMSIYDACFASPVLKNLRVNATLDMFSGWQQTQTTLKLDRVVDAAYSGKKMLLIYGGSGAHNGLDCAQIDVALKGEYYIVNVGSNAQASAAYYFDWFEDLVDDDDIVLWMPECGSWMLGYTRFHDRLWEVNAGHYDSLRYIDLTKFTGVFDAYTTYASSYHSAQQCSYECFWKSGNTYGDNAGVRASQGKTYSYDLDAAGRWDIDLDLYTHQAELIKTMSEKGTKVFFTFPAMDKTAYGANQKSIEGYRDDVLEAFPGLVCISSWETPLVDNEMMFDSEWHLTLDGAKYRTSKLVTDIVNALK